MYTYMHINVYILYMHILVYQIAVYDRTVLES